MKQAANAGIGAALDKYRCPQCHASQWTIGDDAWLCGACGRSYGTVRGVPRLYMDEAIGARDRELKDHFYNGVVGTYYKFAMPLLSLPVRPLRLSWTHWLFFTVCLALCVGAAAHLVNLIVFRQFSSLSLVDAVIAVVAVGLVVFFWRHSYFFYLLLLALPTRIALAFTSFRPDKSFRDVHRDVIEPLKQRERRLRVLDIATGNCASLYRHGWMELDAEYTGVDLSETMLMQGVDFMAGAGVPVEFALADAANLPFEPESFDLVLNYGSLNSLTDPGLALAEMSRVTRPGGVVLFLDEQLYERASAVERAYFSRVLSSHDTIDRCPVELMPADLKDVRVHQVYHFYYICVATKAGA